MINQFPLDNLKESIGTGTYWGPGTRAVFYGENHRIDIGKYCSIAEAVVILGSGTEHYQNNFTSFPILDDKTKCRKNKNNDYTIIGNDVWIGYGAMILPGIYVGDGAIVGAGAVVTKHVMAYSIVAGNPAYYLKQRRFDHLNNKERDELVNLLLQVRWWDWPEAIINKMKEKLFSLASLDDLYVILKDKEELEKNV